MLTNTFLSVKSNFAQIYYPTLEISLAVYCFCRAFMNYDVYRLNLLSGVYSHLLGDFDFINDITSSSVLASERGNVFEKVLGQIEG